MTACAMSILAGLLASGCQKGNSLEQFAKQVSGAKSIRVEATFKMGSENRSISILRQLPNRAKTLSGDVVVVVDDKNGWLEVDNSIKKYAAVPWGGKFFPALGKLVSPNLTACLFAYGVSPLQIAPIKSWKASKSGSNDVWTTTVESQMGPQKYELELNSRGELTRFLNPNGEFLVKKWEINPSLTDSDFKVTIPDGYVMSSLPLEPMSLMAGAKVDFSKMQDNSKKKLGEKWSLVLFSDPADSLSTGLRTWLNGKSFGAPVLEVSLGSGGDFSVSDSKGFWHLVSATPTCVLVDKEGVIRALWQGFDPAQTSRLEAEITKAMKEHA
ncbi:MAG: hypothetical protein WCK51_03515 [Armatimonadota bacterium]